MPRSGRTQAVAHHPWRDRNLTAGSRSRRARRKSLITPGGIATRWDREERKGQGHRSLITPGGIATSLDDVVGICLESLITPGGIATPSAAGLQLVQQSRSSPLEGSQPVGMGTLPLTCTGRSSPLEGSQHVQGGVRGARGDHVAHHPWRDRNAARTSPSSPRSSWVAHHPWRDRNTVLPACTSRCHLVAHHPWRDRNASCSVTVAFSDGSLITPGGIATRGAQQ